METIQFNKIGVNNVINTFDKSALEIDGYIKEIKSNLDSISTVWKGVDAVKYIEKLSTDYLNDLTNIKEALNSFSEYLKTVDKKYTELDINSSEGFANIEV